MGLGPERGPNEAGGLSIPSKVKELPVPVAAVSCGGFFTMALTEEGQIWNWGGKDVTSFLWVLCLSLLYYYLDPGVGFIFQKSSEGALMEQSHVLLVCSVLEEN